MAYYLGRDVHASITTEHELCGIRVSGGKTYADNVLIATAASVTHGALGSASNEITCDAVHGLTTGDPIMLVMDDSTTLTGGLDEDTTYYAVVTTTTKIMVAATRAYAEGFTDDTMDTADSTTVEHAGTNVNGTVAVGMHVTGTGIPVSAYVATRTDADTFELSASTTGGDLDDQTLTFHTVLNFANNTAIAKVNVVRTMNGTSDTAYAEDGTQSTFIFNREYPTYAIANTAGIAGIVADNTASNAVPLQFAAAADRNRISDLVGIDIATDNVDEDIAYFGQRTALKAEVKKGITVTFTRKKSDPRFAVLANSARDGIKTYTTAAKTAYDIDSASRSGSSLSLATATEIEKGNAQGNTLTGLHPINQNWGYRVHLQLKNAAEVIAIRNACISEYSVSLSADGVTEETITLYSSVDPIFDNAPYAVVTPSGDI